MKTVKMRHEKTTLKNKRKASTKKAIGKFGITPPVIVTPAITPPTIRNPIKEVSKSNAPEQFSNLFKGFKDPVKQETFTNRWTAQRPEQHNSLAWGLNKGQPITTSTGFPTNDNIGGSPPFGLGLNKGQPLAIKGYATENTGMAPTGWGIKKELASQGYTQTPKNTLQDYTSSVTRLTPSLSLSNPLDTQSKWGLKLGTAVTTIGNYRKKQVTKLIKKTRCKRK